MSRPKGEILCQCEVLIELTGENNELINSVIESFAPLFRHVIEEFEESHKRVPTKDELIWVCSEHLNANIRELVKKQ
jgi:hypothetical protein